MLVCSSPLVEPDRLYADTAPPADAHVPQLATLARAVGRGLADFSVRRRSSLELTPLSARLGLPTSLRISQF